MERISIFFTWFFYNTSAIWTALLLTALLVPLSASANLEKLVYGAIITIAILAFILLVMGIYNIIQAPQCLECGRLLPMDWTGMECPQCGGGQ